MVVMGIGFLKEASFNPFISKPTIIFKLYVKVFLC